jgi:hypothetical protein
MDDDPLELGDAAFQPGSALCDASNIFAIYETLDGGWSLGRREEVAQCTVVLIGHRKTFQPCLQLGGLLQLLVLRDCR